MRDLHPTPAQARKDHPRHAVEVSLSLRQAFWAILSRDDNPPTMSLAAVQMQISRTALIRAVGTVHCCQPDHGRVTRKVVARLAAWVKMNQRRSRR